MKNFDLLIKGGILVDPLNNVCGPSDLALEGGKVARVETDISPDLAREVFDAEGGYVFPGLVDTHVHLTPPRRAVGLRMLARAGVTCCLDCHGPLEDILEGMAAQGSGIAVAVLNVLDPGLSISGPDAPRSEVDAYLERSLVSGALGFKLLGGHHPLTPETTIHAIEAVNQAGAYAAFHCGSTKNGSNLLGFLDAIEFTGSNRLQICHINAYCRGLTHGSPVTESMLAMEALAQSPHLVSESHVAPFNSAGAQLEDDVPRSHVARTCLEAGGFEATREGLLAAARAGYLQAQKPQQHAVILLKGEEAADYLEQINFRTMVSFPVNRRSTAFLNATAKDDAGRFYVTALSTDGGGIPRNLLLSHGLSLVRFEALTLSEFVYKCALAPARMLGLNNKGHLSPGADGDVVVADPASQEAVLTTVGGRIIMVRGVVIGSGGTIVTTGKGLKNLKDNGVPAIEADLPGSLFYTAPKGHDSLPTSGPSYSW